MRAEYIFLAGGSMTESEKIDTVYFDMHTSGDKILYVPIALGDAKYKSCIAWFKSLLAYHSDGTPVAFDVISRKDSIPNLVDYRSIYLGGGNTYELLDYVYSTGLDNKLTEYLSRGGIVYGGSAGAIVLGKDIRTAEEENLKNSQIHAGLNLLNDCSVICHYKEENDSRIFDIGHRIKSDILAVSNNGGIFVDLKERSIKPYGSVFIFKGRKKIKITEECKFSQINTLFT